MKKPSHTPRTFGTLLLIGGLIAVVAGIALYDKTEEIIVTPDTEAEKTSYDTTIRLAERSVTLDDGMEATFMLPEQAELILAAEGLGKARFMSVSPDGRIFIPDLVDYQLSHEGRLMIVEDFDETTGTFATQHTYLSGLRGPNSVAFYTDEDGKHWLYLALTAHLVRYAYEAGDTEPSSEPEIILEFPNTQAPEAKSVVWHITRTIHIREGRIYITIGSGCDSCEHPSGEMRGMIASVNPDGSDPQVYAEGLRNPVDFTWADGVLYTTENGVDHLGASAPNEVMYRVTEGAHYGWPYCYELDGQVVEDTATAWDTPVDCADVPQSFAYFPPRSAPLGIEYFADAHPLVENTFLVALHGSFDASLMRGYQVVRVNQDGDQEVFMDGFQGEDATRYGRPLDIMQWSHDSFLFTDDYTGRLYLVRLHDEVFSPVDGE